MEERQRKKESDGERLKIDSQMKSKFWPVRMREKQKKLFNQAISRKICLFLMKNSFLAILLAMLISRKPVQRRGIGEKCGFFSTKLVCNVKEKLPMFN